MHRNLTANDRKNLIRLASELPKGSSERRAILSGLEKQARLDPEVESHLEEVTGRSYSKLVKILSDMVKSDNRFADRFYELYDEMFPVDIPE